MGAITVRCGGLPGVMPLTLRPLPTKPSEDIARVQPL